MKRLGELFTLDGRVSRVRYAATGLALLALKCLGEILVLRARFALEWTLLDALVPLRNLGSEALAGASTGLAGGLLLWNVPFVWMATALSRRRVRDAALSPWAIAPVFLPVVGYLALLILAFLPTRTKRTCEERDDLSSALTGVGLALVIAPAMAWLFTLSGWALPLAHILSVLLGFQGGYLFNREVDHGVSHTTTCGLFIWGLAVFAAILAAAVAERGFFFVLMSASLMLFLVLLGAHLGRGLALTREGRAARA